MQTFQNQVLRNNKDLSFQLRRRRLALAAGPAAFIVTHMEPEPPASCTLQIKFISQGYRSLEK